MIESAFRSGRELGDLGWYGKGRGLVSGDVETGMMES